MPRYYFNVHDGFDITDSEGTVLPGLAEANVAAVEFAGAVLREHAAAFWNSEEWKLAVSDEAGHTLFTLRFVAEAAMHETVDLPPGR